MRPTAPKRPAPLPGNQPNEIGSGAARLNQGHTAPRLDAARDAPSRPAQQPDDPEVRHVARQPDGA